VGTLTPKLADTGADLLIQTLPAYLSGEIEPGPQVGEPTYAPMLKKGDGELDFSNPAAFLDQQVRAFNPWPGTYTMWHGGPLKIHQAHAGRWENSVSESKRPGTRVVKDGLPAICTSDGVLILDEVQPAGKVLMSGSAFLLGARDWVSGSND
jgi:methionyl-tRNA formyltransferase